MLLRVNAKFYVRFFTLFFLFAFIIYYLFALIFGSSYKNSMKTDANSPVEFRFEQFPPRNSCIHSNSSFFQIPILVFSCRRAKAIRRHISKLIEYRPDPVQFPIYVSQDCDIDDVTEEIRKFGSSVSFTKFSSDKTVRKGVKRYHRQYYKIARHYKLGLNWVFQNPCYDAVIITEDDLDISLDFFSYFTATYPLLKNDKTLWCVSAWNDNGQLNNIDINAHSLLHRTDFFGGLGWMTTRKIWDELSVKWPEAYWDDFLRRSANRKGRQCIRPEISRTGMTTDGAKGASSGKFYRQFTSRVHLFEKQVNFSEIDLGYLERDVYKEDFVREVRKAPTVTLQEFKLAKLKRSPVKIFYNSSAFQDSARRLGVMRDRIDGVPRNSYENVVPFFRQGVRVYLVSDDYFYYF